jgi:hypothetical protein
MAQDVSHRPLTAETCVRVRINPCGICGGKSDIGIVFSPEFLVYPCQYHSTVALSTRIVWGKNNMSASGTALRTFTHSRHQLVICGQYRCMILAVGHVRESKCLSCPPLIM